MVQGPGRQHDRVVSARIVRRTGSGEHLSCPCNNRAVGQIRVTAVLVPRGPAVAVVLDDQQVAAVGEGAKRFPVVATINGYTWRTSVARMGGEFLLGLNREVRQGVGADAGDSVEVEIDLDTAPREVEVPEALDQRPRGRSGCKREVQRTRIHAPQGVCALDRRRQTRRNAPAPRRAGTRDAPGRQDTKLSTARDRLDSGLRSPTCEAFERLRDRSQHNGRKLSDVAAAVVESHLLLCLPHRRHPIRHRRVSSGRPSALASGATVSLRRLSQSAARTVESQ
jgi:hypothetical protein